MENQKILYSSTTLYIVMYKLYLQVYIICIFSISLVRCIICNKIRNLETLFKNGIKEPIYYGRRGFLNNKLS